MAMAFWHLPAAVTPPRVPGVVREQAVMWDELRGDVSKHVLASQLRAWENVSETRRGICHHCEHNRLPD